MKGLRAGWLSILLILVLCSSAFLQDKKDTLSVKDLPYKYKKWLEEEVVYIISEKEHQVFLSLQTDRERDIFIEAFWKHRDPTPNTPENEFKTEHYRRIKFANERFGRETPTPGWKTDMGRIYIILGEPRQIERLENESELYPTQIWFYDGMTQYGLPSAFYVVFFKKYNAGDYVLYSPIQDGSKSLMWNYSGDPADYLAAYRALATINPALADISINLIPGEVTLSATPSLASDMLIYSRIPSVPTYKVNDSYAEKLLAYKDIIEVDYTANYIESDFMAEVFIDKRNTAFVHYLIEPSRLSFEQYEDKFTAVLEVNGTISDDQDSLIYQFERRIPIEMNSRQITSLSKKLFSFQDVVPVISGKYKLNVIIKNTVSKEFTTMETSIDVPQPGSLWTSRLLLANFADRNPKYDAQIKPFTFGGIQLRPSPRNDFLQTEIMTAFFQLCGINQKLREESWLIFNLNRDNKPVKTIKRKLSEYPDPTNITEQFELKDLQPAYYSLEAILLDASGRSLISQKEPFYITPLESLARPWVLSLPYTSPDNPEIAYILGLQLLNKKNFDQALPLLESAYNHNPNNSKFALGLASAYHQTGNYLKAREIAEKFRESSESSFLLILGESLQALEEHQEAISVFKTYLVKFGTNINVLNAIGDCYLTLNQREEALEAYEKSLELDPGQDKIRTLIKSLKEKSE